MILDRFLVTGRAALVTGAGRGIGAAIAVALAQAGADVLISARTPDELAGVAAQIAQAGRRAVMVPADLSDLDAAAGLADRAAAEFGRLDIVVNNVGGAMPRPFTSTAPRHLMRALEFNVGIAHQVTMTALPHLLAATASPAGPADTTSPAGSAPATSAVINISSVLGRVAGRGYLAYGTAKAALTHYTRLAAADLAPRVRVNAIAVGSVATSALDIVMTDDNLRSQMEQATPLRRIGAVEDIAAAALFLASPAGAFLTGKVIEADGGIDQPNLDLGLPDLS